MNIRTSAASSRRWPSRRQIIGAGTVAVAVVVTLALRPAGRRADVAAQPAASSPASAVSPALAALRPVTIPVSELARIADRLTAAPYETRDTRGDSFEYTDVRVWETEAAGDPTVATTGAALHVLRVRSWTNAGDAGRRYTADEARGCPAEDRSWTHEQAQPFGGPLSSNPDAVHRQLLGPPPNDGIDLFGQIGDLYISRIVPLATRRGLLAMLAHLPHLLVQNNVRDAAGRVGIAVTDTAGPAIAAPGPPMHHTLIFDPATGDLLASMATTTAGTPDYATPPGEHSATLGYTLYLTRRYTRDVRTPKPGCTPPLTRARQSASAGRDGPTAWRRTGHAGPTAAASTTSQTTVGTNPGSWRA